MRLGGYVIHGDNAATLPRCLDSLAAVADELLAVDSCSTDGSAALVDARGFRRIVHPWEGYGAARAVAARALAGCDYVFFLDSDEWLLPDAVETLLAWKAAGPTAPYYTLARRDWAELGTGRFLYRTERHVRLVRADHALWSRDMIVHEALPPAPSERVAAALEHVFVTDVDGLRAKADRYALLWALRYAAQGKRAKPPALEKAGHLVREVLIKGAVLRGGWQGLRVAEAVAHHQARKYALLREIRRGGYAELVKALAEGRLQDLYRALPR